jgi:hypothetical protein
MLKYIQENNIRNEKLAYHVNMPKMHSYYRYVVLYIKTVALNIDRLIAITS